MGFSFICTGAFCLPSREIFFKNPEKTHVQISPNGKFLSYLSSVEGVTFVKQRPISQYYWTYDGKHLLFLHDFGGDENDHLFALNLETLEVKNLTPVEGAKVELLKINETLPNEALILINDRKCSV